MMTRKRAVETCGPRKRKGTVKTPNQLPEVLIMTIILMMPFPSVFRARNLSKTWRHRFSSLISSSDDAGHHDEDERLLTAWFQNEVRERAKEKMGLFYPVCIGKSVCAAYDHASERWVQLPSLSYIPKDILDGRRESRPGPANLGFVFATELGPKKEERFVVTNIYTQSWKLLPPRSTLVPLSWNSVGCSENRPRLFRDASTGRYKVIAWSKKLSGDSEYNWCANIYDSRTNSWRITKLPLLIQYPFNYAYMNGLMYIGTPCCRLHLFTINVDEGTTKLIQLRYNNPRVVANSDVAVWDGQLYMVEHDYRQIEDVRILRADLELGLLLEQSRGPPDSLKDDRFSLGYILIHGRYILFVQPGLRALPLEVRLILYDMSKNEWSCKEFPTTFKSSLPPWMNCEVLGDFAIKGSYQDSLLEPDLDPFWQV